MARSLLVIRQRKVILSYTNKFVKHSQGKIIVQALWKLLDFFCLLSVLGENRIGRMTCVPSCGNLSF